MNWIRIISLYLAFCSSLPAFTQNRTLSRQLIFEKVGRQQAHAFLEDSHGFIWIGAGGLSRYDGYAIQRYRPKPNDADQSSTGAIYALLEDSKGRIWIGAANGLFRYEREQDVLIECPIEGQAGGGKGNVISLFEDKKGRLWLGDRQHLYVMENPDSNTFKIIDGIELDKRVQGALGIYAITAGKNGEIFASTSNGLWLVHSDTVRQLVPESWQNTVAEFQILDAATRDQDTLWLATVDGLWRFDMENRAFLKKELPDEAGKVISKVLWGKANELWIGSITGGVFRFKDGRFEPFTREEDNPYSLSDNDITALMSDRFHNLWIGTFSGINKINFERQRFPFYQIDPGPDRIDNYSFRVLQDSLGGFWFRFIKFGLVYASDFGEEAEVLLQPEYGSNIEEVKSFCLDPDGNVWVITLTKGLYKFENGQKTPRHIDLGDFMQVAFAFHIVSDRIDPRYLWFSSKFGLCRLNRSTLETKFFNPLDDLVWADNGAISSFEQSEDGNFWCPIRLNGRPRLAYFDYGKTAFVAEPNQPGHPSSLNLAGINHFKAVPGNQIWIAARNQELLIVDGTEKTYRFLVQDGSPVKNVRSITPDHQGNIWFTYPGEICKYDGNHYYCYDDTGGIEGFIEYNAALANDGRIIFGGRNGLYAFYPEEITFEKDTVHPEVCLTNVEVRRKKRPFGQAYELIEEIRLPYRENEITFEFAALDFLHTNDIGYRYRLIGYDQEWREIDKERQAPYTNLAPRTYTFQVQASNVPGVWPDDYGGLTITLAVDPPWYRTWAAYLLWLAILMGSLHYFYRFQLRRRLAEAEASRLRELDRFRTRLYTNITHEFRTPLTIINGMAGQLQSQASESAKQGLKMIVRNGRQLLRLVNQMLDLAKLESGSLPIHLVQGDIISYLKYLTESFHSYAESKEIGLHFLTDFEEYVMDYDEEKVLYIVSNLLSNAIKFTPSDGHIYFQVAEVVKEKNAFLEIKVKDSGIGIPKEVLPHIFSRFFQADSSSTRTNEPARMNIRPDGGTGIGLALTKELVDLLGGDIQVQSKVGKGTTFTVLLPARREAATAAAPHGLEALKSKIQVHLTGMGAERSVDPSQSHSGNTDQPLLLIVEDNLDVVQYLVTCLDTFYQLEIANNGDAGIKKAIELVPDIIISDVMMPGKDGFEVCNTLKNDERTSHIPIILLTAKADHRSRIAGLKRGADVYLNKPFDREELLVRLKNLIEQRRKLQKHYRNLLPRLEIGHAATAVEDAFLKKIKNLVEEHMSNSDFDISWLAQQAGMSRVQLFRKIKALTGESPSAFVRMLRLQKARNLLLTTSLNVSEIAYDVGFGDPSFFSRIFKEKYGKTPMEAREQG